MDVIRNSPGRVGKDVFRSDAAMFLAGLLLLAAIIFLVFQPTAARPHAPAEQEGRLEERLGEVRRRAEGTLVWEELRRGGEVFRRDSLFAGPDSEAVVVLRDGSRLVVEENSLVVIGWNETAGQGLASFDIDIVRGGLSGRSRSPLTVRAGGVSALLAEETSLTLRRRGDRSLGVQVEDGRITLDTARGARLSVESAEAGEIAADGSIGERRRLELQLLEPADGARVFFREEQAQVKFRWQGGGPEEEYLFQLSRDADFGKLIAERRPKEPAVELPLPEGVYFWRVHSAGRFSPEARLAVVKNRPPLCLEPRSDEVVQLHPQAGLFLSWTEIEGVEGYLVQLEKDDRLLKELHSDQPRLRLRQELEEGAYCFRVRVLCRRRGESPWSEKRCFRLVVKPLPRPPRLFDPELEELNRKEGSGDRGSWLLRLLLPVAHAQQEARVGIVLRWEKVPGVAGYLLEIAEDIDFKRVVERQRVGENYFRWPRLTQRIYFWRVKSIDAEGREGQFGEPRFIGAVVSPPKPLQPPDGATLMWGDSPPRLCLSWQREQLLRTVFLEIDADGSFHTPLLKKSFREETDFCWTPPRPGRWFWRLSGIDLNGRSVEAEKALSVSLLPAPPRALWPAAGAELKQSEAAAGVRFGWSGRPVKGYQIQLFRGREATEPLLVENAGRTELVLHLPGAGEYSWRVRCLEPESAWSALTLLSIKAPPQLGAPRLLEPAPASKLQAEGSVLVVTLAWEPVADAAGYVLRLRRLPEGTEVLEQRLSETRRSLELSPGNYRWSVRAFGAEDNTGPEAEGDFEVTKRLPSPAPLLLRPAPGKELVFPGPQKVSLAWQPVVGAGRYQIELSLGQGGSRTIEQSAEAQEAKVSLPVEGEWSWRVRALEADGFAGEWSENEVFYYRVVPPPICESRLLVGLHLDYFHNLGGVGAARPSLEVTFRPSWWRRRLGLSVQLGYYTASTSVQEEGGGQKVSSRLHDLPGEVYAAIWFPYSRANFYLGAGPRFEFSRVSVEPVNLVTQRWHFGLLGLAGVEMRLGPGWLLGELRYGWMTSRGGVVELDPGGVQAGVGYRLGVW